MFHRRCCGCMVHFHDWFLDPFLVISWLGNPKSRFWLENQWQSSNYMVICPLPCLIAREYGKHVQKHTYLDGQIGFKTNPDAQQHIATSATAPLAPCDRLRTSRHLQSPPLRARPCSPRGASGPGRKIGNIGSSIFPWPTPPDPPEPL